MHAHVLRLNSYLLICLALAAGSIVDQRPAGAQVIAEPVQASIDMLRQAVNPKRDGSHLPLLFALRQLRDPDLKALFLQLAQKGAKQGEWQIQVHAVLGLAEIDPKHQIDPWLITQISSDAQEVVIATALDLDLLPEAAITEVLQWDQLHPMARLFLQAELQSLGKPMDVEELARLAKSDDSHIAGLASSLLAQVGQADAMKAFETQLATKPVDERDAVKLWLVDAARRYRLTALTGWISQINDLPEIDPDLNYRTTLALLTLDQPAGLAAWEKYLGDQPSYSHRVRSGTMLLAARGPKPIPASTYDKLLPAGTDEELIARIAEVGKAIAGDADPSDALIALLDIGHTKTGIWAMEYLKQLPPERSRKVYEHLIDRMKDPRGEWTEGVSQAVDATSKLIVIDQAAVLDRLAKAEDDSPLQQSILLGLFEANSPEVGKAAGALPRVGSGRADSLARLLQAKYAKSLTPDELKQLGTIACGGGRVSEILQIQAAWLYLKHAGKTDQAMAAIFAKASE